MAVETAVTILGAVGFIVGAGLLLTLFIWSSRRRKTRIRDIAAIQPVAIAPIFGRTRATPGELHAWHRDHAESIERWIKHHERVLEQFADTNMAIDLTANLASDHERLGHAMDLAISQHPEPQMRAQLSRLAGARRDTLDALRRSNWPRAKAEHLVYLQHRDAWLAHARATTHDAAANRRKG